MGVLDEATREGGDVELGICGLDEEREKGNRILSKVV